jgi:hypothetical protein
MARPAAGFSSGQAESVDCRARGWLTCRQGNDLMNGPTSPINGSWRAIHDDIRRTRCVILLVFLVLAAQYESLRLPLAIILIVPMCLLCAISGVWLKGGDNNIFTQIGLIVLVGLACKNAILIVEFARHKQDEEGMAAVPGGGRGQPAPAPPNPDDLHRIHRGRVPAGGFPWRRAPRCARPWVWPCFAGMIGVTLFGLFLTPVFYLTLMRRRS